MTEGQLLRYINHVHDAAFADLAAPTVRRNPGLNKIWFYEQSYSHTLLWKKGCVVYEKIHDDGMSPCRRELGMEAVWVFEQAAGYQWFDQLDLDVLLD